MDAPTRRSALITGATGGIGLQVARTLAAIGHAVAVTHHSGPPCAEYLSLPCDVVDPEQVDRAFEHAEREHGPVEVLVANAGLRRDGPLTRMDVADFTDVLAVNLVGAFNVVRRAAPSMIRSGYSRVVFMSSALAFTGSAGQANYTAAKAGLVGLARSLARELALHGITVNVVAPGLVDTAMTSDLSERQRDRLHDRTPLRRSTTTHEVADTVAHLVGEGAGATTGAVVPVDGGLAMGL